MNRIAKRPAFRMTLASAAILILCLFQLNWLFKAWEFKQEYIQRALDDLATRVAVQLDLDTPFGSRKFLDESGQLILTRAEVQEVLSNAMEAEKFTEEVVFAVYQQNPEGVYLAPELAEEAALRNSPHKVCLSCILTLRFVADTAAVQTPEMTFIRSISEYMALPNSPAPEDMLYLSLYMPALQQSVFSAMWTFALASLLLTAILLAIFGKTIFSIHALTSLNRLQKDFFTNMTHEFKTPLSSIGLAARMLLKDEAEVRKQGYLQLIRDESVNLEHQVDKVLHFAQANRESIEYEKQVVAVNPLVGDTLERLRLVIESRQARIHTEIESEGIAIFANKTHIGNCLYNLIENALKYSKQPPTIHISVQQDGGSVRISVRDTGIGIPPEHRAYIFDRFYRVQSHDHYTGKGFGIGLTYTQSVITAHGGTIQLNPAYLQGAEFIIHLPSHA